MSSEDMSRYRVWRDNRKRQMNMENTALYGITTVVLAIMPVLAHM
ncbi:hypothetical protein [Peribacillus sp. SI8-4]|nr:hypothetical protein [Peribacillus sp. SI8-4]